MRHPRRLLLLAVPAVAAVWLHTIAGSGARLLALVDGVGEASATRVVAPTPRPPIALPKDPARAVAASSQSVVSVESDRGPPAQPISADELSAERVMRLLENELASDTDPAAAEEFLRVFNESLDTE